MTQEQPKHKVLMHDSEMVLEVENDVLNNSLRWAKNCQLPDIDTSMLFMNEYLVLGCSFHYFSLIFAYTLVHAYCHALCLLQVTFELNFWLLVCILPLLALTFSESTFGLFS